MKRRAGDQIVLTYGEYSDFNIVGHFRVLKDFDQGDLIELFMGDADQAKPGQAEVRQYSYPAFRFTQWAVANGWIEDLNVSKEFYLGDYQLSPDAARTDGYGFDRHPEDL